MPSEERLPDDDFWGTPLEAAPKRLDELLGRPQRGLRLWAPASVALDARKTLPVHVGVLGEVAELERLSFLERAIVVAVDVASGDVRTVRVGNTGGAGAPPRLAPPPGFEGGLGPSTGALAAQVTRCVLWDAATAASAWGPGRYRLTVIAADRVSNDVLVDVSRAMSTVDRAVRDAEAADRPLQAWPPPDPTGGLPRYAAVDGSPPPPSEPGVVLAAERVVVIREGAACVLYAAVRARPGEEPRTRHTTIVPVTLVITGTETPGPTVIPMRVPSFERSTAGDGGLIARFAVDLLQLAPLAAAPQTYFVHAFTADGRSVPQPIAVVAG
jgi:hypothetical protein